MWHPVLVHIAFFPIVFVLRAMFQCFPLGSLGCWSCSGSSDVFLSLPSFRIAGAAWWLVGHVLQLGAGSSVAVHLILCCILSLVWVTSFFLFAWSGSRHTFTLHCLDGTQTVTYSKCYNTIQ